ncbi:hypothetical protein BHM03_00018698 [Ensete ventricosum]|nr:hypothetical protein BHM03_00018698 [Ensete ventricosum]
MESESKAEGYIICLLKSAEEAVKADYTPLARVGNLEFRATRDETMDSIYLYRASKRVIDSYLTSELVANTRIETLSTEENRNGLSSTRAVIRSSVHSIRFYLPPSRYSTLVLRASKPVLYLNPDPASYPASSILYCEPSFLIGFHYNGKMLTKDLNKKDSRMVAGSEYGSKKQFQSLQQGIGIEKSHITNYYTLWRSKDSANVGAGTRAESKESCFDARCTSIEKKAVIVRIEVASGSNKGTSHALSTLKSELAMSFSLLPIRLTLPINRLEFDSTAPFCLSLLPESLVYQVLVVEVRSGKVARPKECSGGPTNYIYSASVACRGQKSVAARQGTCVPRPVIGGCLAGGCLAASRATRWLLGSRATRLLTHAKEHTFRG